MKLAHVLAPEPGLDLAATIWNAFVDFLAMSEPNDLSPEQRPAQLVFWYESEVQNGGHLQYFLNRGLEEAREAVRALLQLGASSHSSVLESAIGRWSAVARTAPVSAEDYVEEALQDEFEQFDKEFFAAQPLQEVLERHLNENRGLFVSVG